MRAVLTLVSHCVLQFKRKWAVGVGVWAGQNTSGICVAFEILMILEVLPVRSAIALPLRFKIHKGNDCYFIKLFSFFNLFPKERSTRVK